MEKAILTGVTAYTSTSLDYLIILVLIFGITPKRDRFLVYLGDLLGTAVLVSISLLFAFGLRFTPAEWALGFLGIIPIFMGIKLFFFGEKDDDEKAVNKKLKQRANRVFQIMVITITTCGADNIGIYVPLFSQTSFSEIPLILISFFVMLTIFCVLGYGLVKLPKVTEILDRFGQYITGLVYTGTGIYVLLESGTLNYVF